MQQKFALLMFASVISTAAIAADSYTLDPNHSYPHFGVNHLGFSTMYGQFNKTSGKITLDRANKTASVDVEIDAASLSTGHQKLDDHLRSADFFNVKEFPKLVFKSTKVNFKGDTPATVEGNLTLLGVTKPVTLNIDSFKCGAHPMKKSEMCGIDASTMIKRSDFGMKYGLPNVGDDVKLFIDVEAYKD